MVTVDWQNTTGCVLSLIVVVVLGREYRCNYPDFILSV